LSEHEYTTQSKIIAFLQDHASGEVHRVGKTGVLLVFDSQFEGKSVLIRGDIDALPIQETNSFSHKSTVEGVSHKCGHDGHTTILLGLAMELSATPISSGKVFLLFQPAEENGMGAQQVLDDPLFQQHSFDLVFALHNLPGFETHDIILKSQEFNANVKSIIIRLTGKTSHAAEPEKGHNPAMAISETIQYAEQCTNNHPEQADFFLITPIHIQMGELAYGISAGYGEIHLTIRSWSTELMERQCADLEKFILDLTDKHHLIADISWTQVFYANINHPDAVEVIRRAAKSSGLCLQEIQVPFKWGEDFGLFTQQFPGAMLGLGAGLQTPALHNPDYDFPDEILPTGIAIFHQILHEIL
jgi:amidohydrolase